MRILHTSDWHLGRSFHREGLLDAQSAYVDHLVDTVRAEGVDVVVVSGDIYDRALPPVDAVELANDALGRLLAAKVRVVMTSGNHDSAQRLGFASNLIDSAGIHLRTSPHTVGAPVLVSDRHGDVAIYGLPYLEPELLRTVWELPQRSHQAALDAAMLRVRRDLARRPAGTRSVVMAHAFVVGATPSDSERDISVGGVSSVGLAAFDGIDYTALGHLHGRHTLSASVRYSGSPLAYSFSEARHRKGSWLVDLAESGLGSVEFVDAPVPRRLVTLHGTIDSLLDDPRWVDAEVAWVQATITDAQRPPRAMERLRRRFPHTLVLKFEPAGAEARQSHTVGTRVLGRSDDEVISNFFTDVRGAAPTVDETPLLTQACDACRLTEDAAS
ncbi:MAG: exonuclease SbcCD subunit D [Nocardioidaceae bacterium]|nr:exonuclease SbcCD subunit D [Nocardioidaceae bacterium]